MKLDLEGIPGLTALEAGHTQNTLAGSKFALPPGFDSKKWASKWVEQGPNVIEAQQSTVLQSAGVVAEGWQIYKELKTPKVVETPIVEGEELPLADAKKTPRPALVPVTRAVGKAIFVLMCRPKQLQQVVNIIHANESREMVQREVGGHTNASNPANDEGILTAADMKRFKRQFPDEQASPEEAEYLRRTPLATSPQQATELNLG